MVAGHLSVKNGNYYAVLNYKNAEGKDIEMLEHKLVLVKAEEATAAKEGNIKYCYCENCGKYYSD